MEAAGDVGGELGAGDDFSQEEAGAMAGDDELAVEADEAQAGLHGPVAFEDGGGVDTHARLLPGLGGYPSGHRHEPVAQHRVVIVAEGVPGYAQTARAVVVALGVGESGADDGASRPWVLVSVEEQRGVAADVRMVGQILHRAVVAP